MTFIAMFMSISLLVFALLGLLYWVLIGKKQDVASRLAAFTHGSDKAAVEIPLIFRKDEISDIPALSQLLGKLKFADYLLLLIEQANVPLTVSQLLLIMLASAAVGGFLTFASGNIPLILLTTIIFGSAPVFIVSYLRKKRIKQFEQGFPDAIDMLRNAIRAGFGFVRAIQLVADEAPDPIGLEFRKTFEEINLGMSTREAMINLGKRLDSVDLRLFITAILIQRESGGNLNEILHKISATIRERFKIAGQIKVFTAQGRFTGLILGLLPLSFAAIIMLINPDYMMVLFEDPVGHFLIALSLGLQLVGFFLIRTILRIRLQ